MALRIDHPVQASPEEATRARLLDAAFACAGRFGLGRTTMSDVAREARLSRQTVYRYFPSKHDLLMALVLREEEVLLETIRSAVEPHADLRPALEAAFRTILSQMRAHPLLDRLMATEPQELLPYLTVEANPVRDMGVRLMEQVFADRMEGVSPVLMHRAAELCSRIVTSYAIMPPDDEPEVVAVQLAELVCNGLGKKES
jgi:TetR/AcrR family transcriptional regulator, repressor for uid operon